MPRMKVDTRESMSTLATKTVLGFLQLIVTLGILLFVPAWSFDFWQAWVYLFVFGASTGLITAYLWTNNPALLARRVAAGPKAEKDKTQKLVQLIASIVFIAIILLPALDHRFTWSSVPFAVVFVGNVLVALGFLIVFAVFKTNAFTSATIELASDQHVISTGPYALVRHPMYSGALVMLLGTPLALGSWWGLLILVPMTLVIAWRLVEEERFLVARLPGYAEYCRSVRYRLVPFLW
jgi:protein-S-isoprenylcysteine O-methyltransferase Ste14